jgi:hypothetical protein
MQMLGGMDEASFCQRFGIGSKELREGGAAIAAGGGELGPLLFAAGAGIADIRQVQAKLDTDMQELFKPTGSAPRINKAIAELKVAREQIKESQLPPATWVVHDKALKAAKKRQTEIDRELLEKSLRKSSLERFSKAVPLIATRKRLLEQLVAVADAPLLPDDFTALRRESLSRLGAAQLAEQEASGELKKIQAAIDGALVPAGLLEHRTSITGLHADLGSYQKAAKDRPGLVAQKQQLEIRAQEILQDLGREPDLEKSDELRLTRVQRERIQELVGECKVRFEKHSSTDAALRKLTGDIRRAEEAVSLLPSDQSVDELKQLIRRSQKHGDLDQQLADAQAAVRQLESEAEIELKKLQLFDGTLEQLEQLAVCATETIDRFQNELSDAETAIEKCDGRVEELTTQLQKLDGSLEALRLEHDVPTEVDLEEARRQREVGWPTDCVTKPIASPKRQLSPPSAANENNSSRASKVI